MTEYSSYSDVESEITPEAGKQGKDLPGQMKCYILPPDVVFAARVNQSTATYPIGQIVYDGVTIGEFADIKPGMTFFLGSTAGGNDLGRGRIRTDCDGTNLFIGRSSKGVREGEVTVSDNAYITVLNLYRVQSKIYYITPEGVTYKDGYIGYTDQTIEPPPVSNSGPPSAGTIDKTSGYLRIELDGTNSFPVADEATITDYLWDVGDELIISGAIDESSLVVDFQPGFHYVSLTVTDSNGKEHTSRTFVFAHDSDMREDIQNFQITNHKVTQMGQELSVKIFEDLPVQTYVEGTVIIIWEGNPDDPTDRSNVLFWGWIQGEPIDQSANRDGLLQSVTLECKDTAHMLDMLPGRSIIIETDSNRDETVNADTTWEYMIAPNLDKYIHYILQWHSTALEVADFFWSETGINYTFPVLGSDGQSLYDQANQRCQAFVPDRLLACNRNGQLSMPVDPMLQNSEDRTATEQGTITLDDWSSIDYTRQTQPLIHWLHSDAIKVHPTNVQSYFSVAPGDAPGQGETAQEHSYQLAQSQQDLNDVTGHRYTRINAPQSKYTIDLTNPDIFRIEPANMTWLRVIVGAAQRTSGSTFNTRGLPLEINYDYEYTEKGMIKTATLVWEREVVGSPAVTYTPPVVPETSDGGNNPDLPDLTSLVPEPLFYDLPGAYIMWDGQNVLRTMDITVTSPVWEDISTGLPVTTYIQDIRYFMPTSSSVGAWCMHILGIYVCMDLLTDDPTWELVLDITDLAGSETLATSGTTEFKCMTPYASEPGYLIVHTGPTIASNVDLDYNHSYFYHTHDYGATWTTVDAGSMIERTVAGHTHSYVYTGVQGMEMMREEPTILCMLATPLYVLNCSMRVCISTDGGHTWAVTVSELSEGWNNTQDFSLLHPFPAFNRNSFVTVGDVGVSLGLQLKRSNDLWDTNSVIFEAGTVEPTGLEDYGAISSAWRVNKNPYDNNHMIGWFYDFAIDEWHLFQTLDNGVTWTLLYDSGLTHGSTDGLPGVVPAYVAPYNTPNGWPPDTDIWWIIRNEVSGGSPTGVILMTTDNFATTSSKVGNLATVLPAGLWTNGPAGGFALPKVGINS